MLQRGYNLRVPEAIKETVNDTTVAATPLASLLLQGNPALPLETRGGCHTPATFGDSAAEFTALRSSVGLYDLGFRTRISATGEDKFRWLNGMVTNAVATLPESRGNYNFILNAQGRIQGDAYVYNEPGRLLIDTDLAQAPRLLDHLNRFIIMDDVELTDLSDSTSTAGLAGPAAADLLTRLGLPAAASLEPLQFQPFRMCGIPVTILRAYSVLVPRFELWFDPAQTGAVWNVLLAAGATATGLIAENALRVLEGTPLYGTDIQERNLVQETSQTRALNFTKGCYLGQEIVERIRSRTTVHRFLRQLELHGAIPAPGAELRSPGEERPVGALTSIVTFNHPGLPATLALGYVRTETIDRQLPIEYDGGTATILDAPPPISGQTQASES